MTTDFPDDGMCHETSGFLFNHRCDRFSVSKCMTCEKPLCDDHAHETPEGTLCTTCLKRKTKADRQVNPDNPAGNSATSTSYHEHYYYNDPYFYGTRYYPGYGSHHSSQHHPTTSSSSSHAAPPPTPDDVSGGDFSDDNSAHDPIDFTEGDAGSLSREQDGDFETDMGAS